MFLTVLSAIALTVGTVMTVQNLNDEELSASQEKAPAVEVQAVESGNRDVSVPVE